MWYVGFCTTEKVTIDRERGIVTKQSGVLCFRRVTNAPLGNLSEVSLLRCGTDQAADRKEEIVFDVALTGSQVPPFILGRVTFSAELAREFGQEVATFLSLPLS